MGSKHNIDDIVIWQNDVYIVKSILYLGEVTDSFAYGLIPLRQPELLVQVIVKESLLIGHSQMQSIF